MAAIDDNTNPVFQPGVADPDNFANPDPDPEPAWIQPNFRKT